MRYVQYFEDRDGKLVEPCGDRCVIILDGRNSITTSMQDAIHFNGFRRPNYDAFQIRQGEVFSRSSAMTEIITL
jgi:hypothetical protein